MKLLHLPRECNKDLNLILKDFYMGGSYTGYVDQIYKSIEFPPVNMQNQINNNLIIAIHTAILDNLTRWVVSKDPLSMVAGMQNNTLPLMFDVGYRHFTLITGEEFANSRDSILISGVACNVISQCLYEIFVTRTNEFNQALLSLFEVLYNTIGYLDIKWYKALIMGNGTPGLLVTENTDENCFT